MKKFLLTFLAFIIPVCLLIAGIELYVLYFPSTFNRKADYIRENARSVETLILGSSHHQNALNPEYFHSVTANLANAGQDAQLDSAMFFNFIAELPRLKTVVLEMDYLTMEERNDNDYFRLPWYSRFFNVQLQPISLLSKVSVYASSPAFFNKLLIDEINPKKTHYQINRYGFIVNDFPGVMEDLKYDSLALEQSAMLRLKDKHTRQSIPDYNFNRSKILAIVKYCVEHKIRVVLLSTPMYTTYLLREIPAKNERRKQFINELTGLPGVFYFDFEKDQRFQIHDFKNDDHLNSDGAKKYSLIVDSLLGTLPAGH
jgi:hypothetical protein